MDSLNAGPRGGGRPTGKKDAYVLPSIAPDETRLAQSWAELSPIEPDIRLLGRHRIKAGLSADRSAAPWDVLRTRAAMTMQQNNWTSIAVTSPTVGCGKTTVAMNLAFGLARQSNSRVILVDLNLRRPRVAALLGLEAHYALETFLTGRSGVKHSFVRFGENLAIGPNSQPVEGAAELLLHPATKAAFAELRRRLEPDIIIFDIPAMLASDEVMAFLPLVDCALLVAAADGSNFGEIDVCERDLAAQTNLLGVVLNKCRHGPERYGY